MATRMWASLAAYCSWLCRRGRADQSLTCSVLSSAAPNSLHACTVLYRMHAQCEHCHAKQSALSRAVRGGASHFAGDCLHALSVSSRRGCGMCSFTPLLHYSQAGRPLGERKQVRVDGCK
jgi:hypothetical protein